MINILKRELIYIWYYFGSSFMQIFWYWIISIAAASLVSVYVGNRKRSDQRKGIPAYIFAALLMFSLLLNPRLLILSAALGAKTFWVRVETGFLCCCAAGLLVYLLWREEQVCDIKEFEEPASAAADPDLLRCFLKTFGRKMLTATPRLLGGLLLSTLILVYLPRTMVAEMFGGSRGRQALTGAIISIPLNVCGAGVIVLQRYWMTHGMSMGCAAAFMLVGPAMKTAALRKVKRAFGTKKLAVYIIFVLLFAFVTGMML